jgi:NarL family two-component system response regulator LiaR
MKDERIRIFIVDDQLFFIEGLKRVLEQEPGIEIVGHALSGSEAVRKIAEILPDVVLMDISLPGMDGIKATRLIRKQNPGVQVIMLTIADDPQAVIPAIKAGAMGYLLKDETPQQLVKAIRAVSKGEALLSSRIATILLHEFQDFYHKEEAMEGDGKVYEHLTPREIEVLNWIAEGLSNKEIAQKLSVAERTIKSHISNIFQKLHVNDRTQAVVIALQQRLIGRNKDVLEKTRVVY